MADEDFEQVVKEIIADGKLSRAELARFEASMMADGQLSVKERKILDHLLNMIANGELELTD